MAGDTGVAGHRPFCRLVPGSVGLAGFPARGHRAAVPFGGLPPLWRLAFAAMTEELAYRALLQRQLEQCVPGKWGLFTGGMLLTSALFALSHLPTHTPLMAAFGVSSLRSPSGPSGRATARSGSAPPSISGTTCFFFSRASSYPLHADTRPASKKDTIKTEALEGRGAHRAGSFGKRRRPFSQERFPCLPNRLRP